MALRSVIAAFLFALALANVRLSAGAVVRGKISCLDCHGHKTIDLSGIKVLVKCDKVKKLSAAVTNNNGFFQAELPLAQATNCLAKVVGGTRQLYATKNSMVSKITAAQDSSHFTTSTPLVVSATCASCKDSSKFGSSKTVDLPIPREWGLAPTSYYMPFVPIIGIP